MTNQPEKYYTLQEVALRLRMSTRTVHRNLADHELEGLFFNRRWHFTESHIRSYTRRHRRSDSKGVRKLQDIPE